MQSICFSKDQNASIGLALRQDFIDKLTFHRYFLKKSDLVLTEIFTSIYDTYFHDEVEFTNSVLFTIFDLLPNNTDAHTIGKQALEFYDKHKESLACEPENGNVKMCTKFNLLFPENFAQLMKASSCPIDYELLKTAVTLSCGHTLNENSAELIYGKLNKDGKCETKAACYCESIPTHYVANKIIRDAATIIEEISDTLKMDQKPILLTSHQEKLIKNLFEILTSPYMLTSYSSAMIYNEDQCKDITQSLTLIPDYTLRDLTNLSQTITNFSTNKDEVESIL